MEHRVPEIDKETWTTFSKHADNNIPTIYNDRDRLVTLVESVFHRSSCNFYFPPLADRAERVGSLPDVWEVSVGKRWLIDNHEL